MTSSATSSIKQTLEAYLAGRLKAERVVGAVAEVYYGDGGKGKREGLRPLMEVIERAHPGVVALAGTPGGERPGFTVQLAERPFPKEYEAALRRAAEAVVGSAPEAARGAPEVGWLGRLVGAIRRLFSASA
jgi:hypothetical protein